MPKDFTLSTYRQLLSAIIKGGYSIVTFEDWCDNKAHGRYVILRHDVDLNANNSLVVARIEAEMGIRASYYFRVIPQSNIPSVIMEIADLGHEIGYHYEDLSLFKGDRDKSIEHFERHLTYFRQFYPVRTICMHGSPASKWDNRDLWKTFNYTDFGIVGEPYFDLLSSENERAGNLLYLTDTGRMWDGDKYNVRDKIRTNKRIGSQSQTGLDKTMRKDIYSAGNRDLKMHTSFDVIDWLRSVADKDQIMITTHPQRWTDSSIGWYSELLKQRVKNLIKRFLLTSRTDY